MPIKPSNPIPDGDARAAYKNSVKNARAKLGANLIDEAEYQRLSRIAWKTFIKETVVREHATGQLDQSVKMFKAHWSSQESRFSTLRDLAINQNVYDGETFIGAVVDLYGGALSDFFAWNAMSADYDPEAIRPFAILVEEMNHPYMAGETTLSELCAAQTAVSHACMKECFRLYGTIYRG